jgi:uncharacterized membrane protein
MKRMGQNRWSGDTMKPDGFSERGRRARRSTAVSICLALLSVAALAGFTRPARADLRLCNKTESKISVAIGYKSKESWVTEGWWTVDASSCDTIVDGPLDSRYYYVYAVDTTNGGEWGGQAFMCTREKEFTIPGIDDCVARGFERTGFFEVDTGEQRNWIVQLTERPAGGIGGR